MERLLSFVALLVLLQPNWIATAQATVSKLNDDACIKFELLDKFGDGWDSASFHLVNENGLHEIFAPSSSRNPLNVNYCFDSITAKDGDSVVVGVYGLTPKHSWEVYWTATITSGIIYKGTYKTFMTFKLNSVDGISRWTSLAESHDLLSSKSSCVSCEEFNLGASLTTTSPNTASITSGTTLLSNNLYGKSDSWSSLDGYGTTFDISSADGLTRFFSGSLCNGKSTMQCELKKLPAGDYVWRVSGAMDENMESVAWDFCHLHGGAMTEVTFSLDNAGQCTPMNFQLHGSSKVEYEKKTTTSESSSQSLPSSSTESESINMSSTTTTTESATTATNGIETVSTSATPKNTTASATVTVTDSSSVSNEVENEVKDENKEALSSTDSSSTSTTSSSTTATTTTVTNNNVNANITEVHSSSKWKLQGTISVCGLNNLELTKAQATLLAYVIADTLTLASVSDVVSQDDVSLLHWESTATPTDLSSEAMQHEIEFSVAVVPESFGFSYSDHENNKAALAQEIQYYLQTSIDSNMFLSELSNLARKQNVDGFCGVSTAHVTYELSASEGDGYDNNETILSIVESFINDNLTHVVIGASIAVAFTLLIIVLTFGNNKVKKASQKIEEPLPPMMMTMNTEEAISNQSTHDSNGVWSPSWAPRGRKFTKPASIQPDVKWKPKNIHDNIKGAKDYKDCMIDYETTL
eukprot:gene6703-13587_t